MNKFFGSVTRRMGLIGLMGLSVGIQAAGQTNLITFTNTDGRVISNAAVVKILPNKIICRTDYGFAGQVYFTNLSRELQRAFGYDAEKASAAEKREKERASRDAAVLQSQRERLLNAEASRKALASVEATRTVIWGRVIQVLKAGLLVSATDGDAAGKSTPAYEAFKKSVNNEQYWKTPRANGIILLIDFRGEALDGDTFVTIGYPVGTFSYATVNGSQSTIRKYTADAKAWMNRLEEK